MGNNLKSLDAAIPVGLFTCVTGVSGSGKSTLVQDTLYPRLLYELYGTRTTWAPSLWFREEICVFAVQTSLVDLSKNDLGPGF